jgi:tRNA modification GTPase
MVAWMAAPRSFTSEDTIEISCHGGTVVSSLVLRAVLAAGARQAEPGEFTLRAFLHGRIPLAEAEAILQVVSAHSADALERAIADLRGDFTRRIEPARQSIISALAYLDASADFPDDEITVSDVGEDLDVAISSLSEVLAGIRHGQLLSDGATVALIGRPNVGKSSLLNALLRSNRAIVTPIAGTTRDTVSERASLSGIPVTLIDTAGIAESGDPVELAGIERSREAMQSAACVVLVLDGSVHAEDDDLDLARTVHQHYSTGALGHIPLVVAINKSDLDPVDLSPALRLLPDGVAFVQVSALNGSGLADLEGAIASTLGASHESAATPTMVTARQAAELDRAMLHLAAAKEALFDGFPTDVLASDVRAASRAIGRITGEDIDDSVLIEIFSRFCIGK